jgi:hypothetical protein
MTHQLGKSTVSLRRGAKENPLLRSSGLPETPKANVSVLVKGGDADKINSAGEGGVGKGVVQRQKGVYKESLILYHSLRF